MSASHRPDSVRPAAPSSLAVALAVAVAGACGGGKPGARASPTPLASLRAAPGDTIYVVEHVVRADRRGQFERFLQDDVLARRPPGGGADTTVARVLRQTRVVYPVRANEDGTSVPVLMDPVVPGETYNIRALLRRVYGDGGGRAPLPGADRELGAAVDAVPVARVVQPRYPTEP